MSLMIRFFDILISLLGLILISPLLILVTILIWLDNGSPFFLQERVGLEKKPFILLKFRTMHKGTASMGTHLIKSLSITKSGIFLRRTKLDELPQLWNVFIGKMSMVGPRPCLFNQKKLISARMKCGIYKAKPGITGLAQINGINMSTPELLAKMESKMVKEMNLSKYFYYIFVTIHSILKKRS